MSNLEPLDRIAELAREFAAEADVTALWRRVVDASVQQIEGAQHAGITVIDRRSVSTPAASDDLVAEIDRHQYGTGQGPCLQAAIDHEPVVRADDLRVDGRWPEFAKRVTELGILSMLSFQLYTDRETIGALNLYAEKPDAFNDESVQMGLLLATHAALAAAAKSTAGNLRVALASRDVIGQAKGILMERYRLTADQAFDLLIAASQRTQRKLNDVASELAATGELRAE